MWAKARIFCSFGDRERRMQIMDTFSPEEDPERTAAPLIEFL